MQNSSPRILIIVSRFNEMITSALFAGAEAALLKSGLNRSQIETIWVPGAFEIPVVAAAAARRKKFDAVIALGCVIRGETIHFELVAEELSRGIMDVSIEHETPVICGVLATENLEQAMKRASLSQENKGQEFAHAALEMVKVMAQVKNSGAGERGVAK